MTAKISDEKEIEQAKAVVEAVRSANYFTDLFLNICGQFPGKAEREEPRWQRVRQPNGYCMHGGYEAIHINFGSGNDYFRDANPFDLWTLDVVVHDERFDKETGKPKRNLPKSKYRDYNMGIWGDWHNHAEFQSPEDVVVASAKATNWRRASDGREKVAVYDAKKGFVRFVTARTYEEKREHSTMEEVTRFGNGELAHSLSNVYTNGVDYRGDTHPLIDERVFEVDSGAILRWTSDMTQVTPECRGVVYIKNDVPYRSGFKNWHQTLSNRQESFGAFYVN